MVSDYFIDFRRKPERCASKAAALMKFYDDMWVDIFDFEEFCLAISRPEGLDRTIHAIKEADLEHIGTGRNIQEATKGALAEASKKPFMMSPTELLRTISPSETGRNLIRLYGIVPRKSIK